MSVKPYARLTMYSRVGVFRLAADAEEVRLHLSATYEQRELFTGQWRQRRVSEARRWTGTENLTAGEAGTRQ